MEPNRRRPFLQTTASLAAVLCLATGSTGCFGIIREPARHYYVLHVPVRIASEPGHLGGLLRVRDVDTGTAYDRMQMVVRKSDTELAFRPRDTWAVKPGRMVSDVLARALSEVGTFDGVTRELSERRPNFTLSGELHALEVEQADTRWQAHLALSLQLTDTDGGQLLWAGHYDEHELCSARDYGVAVQALSAALERIVADVTAGLRALPPGRSHGSTHPASGGARSTQGN